MYLIRNFSPLSLSEVRLKIKQSGIGLSVGDMVTLLNVFQGMLDCTGVGYDDESFWAPVT